MAYADRIQPYIAKTCSHYGQIMAVIRFIVAAVKEEL